MNVEDALGWVKCYYAFESEASELGDPMWDSAYALAREVDRLRAELLIANAEQERLENQLDSVRSELVAATVKLDEWERVGLVAADLKELFRNDSKIFGSR